MARYTHLETHGHEIVEFVHTGHTEPHDRGMCQTVKHLAHRCWSVQLLRFKQLLHQLGIQHGFDDIVQYLVALIGCDILSVQPLIQDINHLSSHVDQYQRHAP